MQKSFIEANYNKNDILAKMIMNVHGVHTYCYQAEKIAEDSAETDHYMSLNTLMYQERKIRRNQEHVRCLKFLYMDLDTYHTGYSNDQILMNLEENYFNRSIPVPSYVVSSGRGLYLLWRVDEHYKAYSRWKEVQEHLYHELRVFGADRSVVTDSARVFRIPGSINSKSGKMVEIIRDYGRKYTLYEIKQGYMDEVVNPGKKEKNSRFIPYAKQDKLFLDRIRDLKHLLLNFRDQESAYRENILFLYRYYQLCFRGDKRRALEKTLQLNSQLVHPLPEKEVMKATASAEKYFDDNCSFKIKSETLIEFLALTEEEIRAMAGIPTKAKEKEKNQRKNRNAYRKRLKKEGKQTKAYQIFHRRLNMYRLLLKQMSKEEIMQKLNIGKSTYATDKKVVDKLISAIKRPVDENAFIHVYKMCCPDVKWMEEDVVYIGRAVEYRGNAPNRNHANLIKEVIV